MAFEIVPATCARVGEAMNELRREIEELYGIRPEDSVALDLAIHRAIARVKANATEPLRKALVLMCQERLAASDMLKNYRSRIKSIIRNTKA